MTNSIRPVVVASLQGLGEAQNAILTGTPGYQGRRWLALARNRSIQGQRGVFGDGTNGRSMTTSRDIRRISRGATHEASLPQRAIGHGNTPSDGSQSVHKSFEAE